MPLEISAKFYRFSKKFDNIRVSLPKGWILQENKIIFKFLKTALTPLNRIHYRNQLWLIGTCLGLLLEGKMGSF